MNRKSRAPRTHIQRLDDGLIEWFKNLGHPQLQLNGVGLAIAGYLCTIDHDWNGACPERRAIAVDNQP